MIYSDGNSAKQWIFSEIHRRFENRPVRILDLGCGSGMLWKRFLELHPMAHVTGIDTDQVAIQKGMKEYGLAKNMSLSVFDAQKLIDQTEFDVVTALSAIEHVVDREAFIRTVWQSLKRGGFAYLNYDVGHFRSRNIKERIMVPVSQLLAYVGFESPYMKRVDDVIFLNQLEKQGFYIVRHMKHNASCLKPRMKQGGEDVVRLWVDFETRLNELLRPEELDPFMLSTTVVVQKP
ncbi:MAG: class I SAM-dependent methyltransferase [bacterium]|nr:class I SAM-dependent methyltransferase [bacterium]